METGDAGREQKLEVIVSEENVAGRGKGKKKRKGKKTEKRLKFIKMVSEIICD